MSHAPVEELRAGHAGLDRLDRAVERLLARAGATRRSPRRARRRRTSASCPRSRPISLSRGKRSITIGSPARIWPEPMSWPTRALRAVRDDELVAVAPCSMKACLDRDLHALARQRLAVQHEPAVRRLGARGAGRAPRPSRPRPPAARAGCPASSASFFDAAAVVEELPVGAQLDAVRAQVVGELDGKPVGTVASRRCPDRGRRAAASSLRISRGFFPRLSSSSIP